MFTQIPTVSSQVMRYLERNKNRKSKVGKGWVSNGELEDVVSGHTGSSITRICRYMARDNEIKREYFKVIPNLRALVFYKK